MRSKVHTTCIALIIFNLPLHAQISDTSSVYSLIGSYLEDATAENSNEQIYDLVEQLLKNPLDLNNASVEDLLKIPFIDITTASGIIEYREKSGRIFSPQELYMIPDIPSETVQILNEFVFIDNREKQQDIGENEPEKTSENYSPFQVSLRSRLFKDLQERRGFTENRFLGNDLKTYNRIHASYKNFKIGILAEKDAGEALYSDFLSYHLELRDAGFLDRLVAGDYLVEFGQGLALWGPYSFSKGSDATGPIIRQKRNIVSYTSSDENRFFRGIAAGLSFGIFDISLFYSSKNLDASVDTGSYQITSLVSTGFHRSETEISKKSTVSEKVYGAAMNLNLFRNTSLNLAYVNSGFSLPHKAENFRDLSGSTFRFYSVSYSTVLANLYVSGEIAYDGDSFAWINGLQYSLNRRVALLASARSYDKSYNSLYSNGFGESSNTQNEHGFYLGIRWNSAFGLINIYYDQFKFPSATFSNPLPSFGNEILFNYSSSLSKKISLVLRYKIENKEISGEHDGYKIQLNRQKQNVRLDFKFNLSRTIKFRTRLEYALIEYDILNSRESGFLTFQDFQYTPLNNLSLYSRIVFFQTDSYNSRIYEFENDLRGVMTNTPLFGKGMKWYLMIKYSFLKMFTLSIKYSELFKPEDKFLGSGYSEIPGNLDNKISLQVDLVY